MNGESGFSGSGVPYEYTIGEASSPKLVFKRLTLIALYVLWTMLLLLVGGAIKIIVPLLALIPISLWILVWLTWRFTQVEYEYSFFSGILTVSRILGGKKRKVLLEIDLRRVECVLSCRDENADRISAYPCDRTVFAASSDQAVNLFAVMWRDEDGERILLYFEPTEKALKIMRYYNAAAVSLRERLQ